MSTHAGAPADTPEPPEQDDRRRQILEAAVRVFSVKGFHKATNKDVADEAGISAGLIYHYFKDKQDLLMSIISERLQILRMVEHPEQLMRTPPREALTLIGRAYLHALRSPANVALLRIVLGEVFRFPQIGDLIYRGTIGRVFGVLVRYLEHQIALGTLRPHDPRIAVRTFMGGFLAHILMREIFHQPEAASVDDEAVVRQVVDTFLEGLGAQE